VEFGKDDSAASFEHVRARTRKGKLTTSPRARAHALVKSRVGSMKYIPDDAGVHSFHRCVLNPKCKLADAIPRGKTQQLNWDAMATMLKQLQDTRLEASVLESCFSSLVTASACFQPGGALFHVVLDTFRITNGTLLDDLHWFRAADKVLKAGGTGKEREQCDACPHVAPRVVDSMDECVGCRCPCLTAGVHVLGSSWYRPRIDHCLEFIERERILFLDYHVVIKDIPAALRQITAHAGLDDQFNWSSVSSQAASARFDALYPSFTRNTGWAQDNVPDIFTKTIIPADLYQQLHAFYIKVFPCVACAPCTDALARARVRM